MQLVLFDKISKKFGAPFFLLVTVTANATPSVVSAILVARGCVLVGATLVAFVGLTRVAGISLSAVLTPAFLFFSRYPREAVLP